MSTLTSSPATTFDDVDREDLTEEQLAREAYENWLETESGVECVDGRIVEKPMAKKSGSVALQIAAFLIPGGRDPTVGWRVFDSSVGFKVYPDQPKKFRKPDVSVVRRARLVEDDDPAFFHIPADLAVEVVSPTDKATALIIKAREYLAHGFKLVWIVDPESRTVLVFRSNETQSLILGPDDEIDGGDVLPGFRCKVSEFFES